MGRKGKYFCTKLWGIGVKGLLRDERVQEVLMCEREYVEKETCGLHTATKLKGEWRRQKRDEKKRKERKFSWNNGDQEQRWWYTDRIRVYRCGCCECQAQVSITGKNTVNSTRCIQCFVLWVGTVEYRAVRWSVRVKCNRLWSWRTRIKLGALCVLLRRIIRYILYCVRVRWCTYSYSPRSPRATMIPSARSTICWR